MTPADVERVAQQVGASSPIRLFVAVDVAAMLTHVRREALEEAAHVCEAQANLGMQEYAAIRRGCAAAIRAVQEAKP